MGGSGGEAARRREGDQADRRQVATANSSASEAPVSQGSWKFAGVGMYQPGRARLPGG